MVRDSVNENKLSKEINGGRCVTDAFTQARNELELPMTLSPPIEPAPTLLSAPIELAGDWGHMLPRSADLVVERMRHSCLDGVGTRYLIPGGFRLHGGAEGGIFDRSELCAQPDARLGTLRTLIKRR